MEEIVQNGLNSIRVGLEDFEQAKANEGRLTSAVRNVYAGILILAKAKLYELSPAGSGGRLIRVLQPKLVGRDIQLVPKGRQTIDYDEIRARFKQLGLELDWGKIEAIRVIRNDLEHFYHDGATSSVQQALADAAPVIRNLLDLLKLEPVRDLGQQWWEILLRNQRLHEEELGKCRETLSGIEWINETARAGAPYLRCCTCDSPLVRQANAGNTAQCAMKLACIACGAVSEADVAMERAVEQQFFRELYEAHTQGGEFPVVYCPACRNNAVVMDTGECASCGHALGADTQWCDECHNPISEEEARLKTHRCLHDLVD